jgi:hypothetical protein
LSKAGDSWFCILLAFAIFGWFVIRLAILIDGRSIAPSRCLGFFSKSAATAAPSTSTTSIGSWFVVWQFSLGCLHKPFWWLLAYSFDSLKI